MSLISVSIMTIGRRCTKACYNAQMPNITLDIKCVMLYVRHLSMTAAGLFLRKGGGRLTTSEVIGLFRLIIAVIDLVAKFIKKKK